MTARSRVLLDERGPASVRERIGDLLSGATEARFAVTRIRLAALDLSVGEIYQVQRCRVLLGQLDAGALLDMAEGDRGKTTAARVGVLLDFVRSGRLEVRSAGVAGWTPDFSVYDLAGELVRPAALLGAHYFGAPYPMVGPSFTILLRGSAAVRMLADRFDELWPLGHDVLPAIRGVLERAHALASDAGGRGGGGDREGAAAAV